MRVIQGMIKVVVGFSLFAASAHAETAFEKLIKYYDQGTKPEIASFAKDAVWAGKCVSSGAPEQAMSGVLNTFVYGQSDPVITNHHLYMSVHRGPDNSRDDYFLQMDRSNAQYVHESARESLKDYFEVKDNSNGDPVAGDFKELIFPYRETNRRGQIIGGVDYTLRNSVTPEGTPFFVVAGRCPFQYCDYGMAYRDRFLMCYVWVDKFAGTSFSTESAVEAALGL
jgi:hypothetical protein